MKGWVDMSMLLVLQHLGIMVDAYGFQHFVDVDY